MVEGLVVGAVRHRKPYEKTKPFLLITAIVVVASNSYVYRVFPKQNLE